MMQEYENPGYIFLDREWNPDMAILYESLAAAEKALEEDLFIDDLCMEDCTDAAVPGRITDEDLSGREIVDMNDPNQRPIWIELGRPLPQI